MPKVTDYNVSSEVTDIMEKFVNRFQKVFGHFNLAKIGCMHTHKKENEKRPLTLKAVGYPYDVYLPKTYLVEVAQKTWAEMEDRQKHLAVFHIMCAIPEGGFDEQSKSYAKKRRPDYEIFAEEFAVTGGIPNWMENDAAKDPLLKTFREPVKNPVESTVSA